MPNYRRARAPGGTFSFTVVTHRRQPLFESPVAQSLLGSLLRRCQLRWLFTVNAVVLLPDHLHAIWSLPPGDNAYSRRWGWIKKSFTQAWLQIGGEELSVSAARAKEGRRGIWQPRLWEHTLEDDGDFDRHFDYLHYNPVKHDLVRRPRDWPASSFHRWVRAGVYDRDWGAGVEPRTRFEESNCGERFGE